MILVEFNKGLEFMVFFKEDNNYNWMVIAVSLAHLLFTYLVVT